MNLNFSMGRLKQRDIALIVVAITAVAAGLWFFYLYKPTQEHISTLEADIASLEVKIQRGEAAKANLPALKEAVARAEEERRAFLAELPTEDEVAALIDSLRNAATSAEVSFDSLSQNGRDLQLIEEVRALNFGATTTGTFRETMTFLQTLESFQRFTNIHQVDLSLTNNESDNPNLNSNYAFTVYVFTGDPLGAQP